jgi:hypothetical protein
MLLISNGKAEMFVLQQLICLVVLLCHLAQGRMARLKLLNQSLVPGSCSEQWEVLANNNALAWLAAGRFCCYTANSSKFNPSWVPTQIYKNRHVTMMCHAKTCSAGSFCSCCHMLGHAANT